MHASSRRRRAFVGIYWSASALTVAFVVACIHADSFNTLHENGRWLTPKVHLVRSASAGVAFRTMRPALYRNHLNLGAWWGFEQVICEQPLPAHGAVRFRFRLVEDAHLSMLIGDDPRGWRGLRFSRSTKLPGTSLASNAAGLFLKQTPLAAANVDEGWHQVRLEMAPDHATVLLDDEPITELELDSLPKRLLSFRGGLRECLVDDVRITADGDEEPLLRDSFRSFHGFPRSLGLALLAVTGLNACLLALTWRRARAHGAPRLFYPLTLNLMLAICGAVWWGYDFHVRAARYTEHIPDLGYINTIEPEEEVLARIDQAAAQTKPADTLRVLCIGSSQTWGAGAAQLDDCWVHVLEQRLNSPQRPDTRYECLNAGICAAQAQHLAELYVPRFAALRPDLVIIDLSHNDRDLPAFEQGLRAMIAGARAVGAQVLFVLEPNAPEGWDHELTPRHQVMRDLAAAEDLPLVDMHAYFQEATNAGFLWWDVVHLTSAGQRLFAERLSEEVEALLLEASDKQRAD